MSIIKYKAFVKVAETGSLTKAARVLGYSQPGISHMINSLETELGITLLIRRRDSIHPTEDGKRILSYCMDIIKNEEALQETASEIRGAMAGTLSIGSLNTMLVSFLPKVIAEFSKDYPKIQLMTKELRVANTIPELTAGTIDLAFTCQQKAKEINFLPLYTDTICIAVPKSHPAASLSIIEPEQLGNYDFIVADSNRDDLLQFFEKQCGFIPQPRYTVSSDTAGISMAQQGLGLYVMARSQERIIPDDIVMKDVNADMHRTMGIAVRTQSSKSPAAEKFIEAAKSIAKEFKK